MRILLRAVECCLREHSPGGVAAARLGAVVCIHRFGCGVLAPNAPLRAGERQMAALLADCETKSGIHPAGAPRDIWHLVMETAILHE